MNDRVYVNEAGWLLADGIKLGKVTGEGTIEIKDKNGPRSRERGTAFVEVTVDEILLAVRSSFVRGIIS